MNTSNVDKLVALATDVLAQSEARQRAARRLQETAHRVNESMRFAGSIDSLEMEKLRGHSTAIRELADVERSLLDEFDAALSQLR